MAVPRGRKGNGGMPNVTAYFTDFNTTENPLSEGGAWTVAGSSWSHVATANGRAYGTQTGSNGTGYDDSNACLSGFSQNHQGEGVIYVAPGITGTHEIEILLRWAINGASTTGLEISFDSAGGVTPVRWNGAYESFSVLTWDSGTGSKGSALADGDIIKAKIVGSTVTAYINGTLVGTVVVASPPSGQPGIGLFYRAPGSGATGLEFKSFTATDM